MNRRELCELIPKLTPKRLTAWIKDGLPHTRCGRAYQFDPEQVEQWIVARDHGSAPRIVRTIHDVAQHFGKSERTIVYWKARGMPRHEHPVGYDLDAIAAWREQEGLSNTDEDRERAQLAKVQREMAELKLQQLRGELVELEPVRRLIARQIYVSRTHLEQLPDRVLACQPPTTKTRILKQIRRDVLQAVDQTSATIAEQLADPELASAASIDRDREAEFVERIVSAVARILTEFFPGE